MTKESPAGTVLLAKGLNPDEGGAEIVVFETPSGGGTFSVGSIVWPASLLVDDDRSRGITAQRASASRQRELRRAQRVGDCEAGKRPDRDRAEARARSLPRAAAPKATAKQAKEACHAKADPGHPRHRNNNCWP